MHRWSKRTIRNLSKSTTKQRTSRQGCLATLLVLYPKAFPMTSQCTACPTKEHIFAEKLIKLLLNTTQIHEQFSLTKASSLQIRKTTASHLSRSPTLLNPEWLRVRDLHLSLLEENVSYSAFRSSRLLWYSFQEVKSQRMPYRLSQVR